MNRRRTGYCPTCDSNVVHTRTFQNRLAWQFDRVTFGMLGLWHILHAGPWRCVDCGRYQIFIHTRADARRRINEQQGVPDDGSPVANFIRTRESLVHTIPDSSQYSDKYRAGVVQKLLAGQSTVSRVCAELQVSELEVQQWIRAWVESELRRVDESVRMTAAGVVTVAAAVADSDDDCTPPGDIDLRPGRVIESQVVRKRN